jgi:hypothetical protein
MDLRLYSRVIWRFRIVVGLGLLLACALSFFSYAKLSFKGGSPTISYRQAETWQASTLMLMTQKGFPYGYTVLPYIPAPTTGGQQQSGLSAPNYVPEFGTPGTFTQLAVYYAPLVHSDAFQALLRSRTRARGVVQANTVMDSRNLNPLPYIDLSGFSTTPVGAVALANAGAKALDDYIVRQQQANHVPKTRRVVAEVVSSATSAIVSAPRKKTTPIVVFMTVLLAAIGFAFVLENLRPRIHALEAEEEQQAPAAAARRPA